MLTMLKRIVAVITVLVVLSMCTFGVYATNNDTELLPDYKIGDVNLDGTVNIVDVSVLQMYMIRKAPLSGQQLILADVDGNSIINIVDASYMQLMIVRAWAPSPTPVPTEATSATTEETQATTKDVITLPFVPAV